MKDKQAKQKRRAKMKHRKKIISQKGKNKRLMLETNIIPTILVEFGEG